MHVLVELNACWFEFGGICACLNRVSALWEKPGSAAEGTFGRRTLLWRQPSAAEACPRKETFVSVWEFQPPKVPPNMHEFRLCLGVSAAEGAAEPA